MNRSKKTLYKNIDEASFAAKRLNIKSSKDYREKYKLDYNLPAHPNKIYADQWRGWLLFLDTGSPAYVAYSDARSAVRKLGIKTFAEYQSRRKEDAKLPSNPNKKYSMDWSGWADFTGHNKSPYESLEDASNAAVALGITSRSSYEKKYKLDPRLRFAPQNVYKLSWVDWSFFLGDVYSVYATMTEAASAASSLNICSKKSYEKNYIQDDFLPKNPSVTYKAEWKGWRTFFGKERVEKYKCLAEASAAAINLGIKTGDEYRKRFKEDPKLVRNPNREYANEWQGIKQYLGTGLKKYPTYDATVVAVRTMRIVNAADYANRYQDDPRLHSNPWEKFKDDWISWRAFLGERCTKKTFYKTLTEASCAARILGISNQTEYNKLYQNDERLTSAPQRKYKSEWTSWYDFLGKNPNPFYETLSEASFAAKRLGIKTSKEYIEKRKIDPKLSSIPYDHYKDWSGWKDFLGTKAIKYETYEEASLAARGLFVDSALTYKKLYKNDPKLPADPRRFYKSDWSSWHSFLNIVRKYKTLLEASEATVKLKVKNVTDYRNNYHKDPMLFRSPDMAYKDEWISWETYLKKERRYPLNKGWENSIEKYISLVDDSGNKERVLKRFYFHYYEFIEPSANPSKILHVENEFQTKRYKKFVFSFSDISQRITHRIICDYFDWILDEYCSYADKYERLVLDKYRNPLHTILRDFAETLPPSKKHCESNKPVIPLCKVDEIRNYLFPNSKISFRDACHLHEMFNVDWVEISKDDIDYSDPDCVWRNNVKTGVFQIWCPARAIALYALLRIPLRGQQILWLDSGENDSEIPILSESGEIIWVGNQNILSSHRESKTGFITRLESGVGMYVNTNKTSSIEGGYSAPYIPIELADLIIRLRCWQFKYNPLKSLTSWTDIKLNHKVNINKLKARGAQPFLFRSPKSDIGQPFSTTQAFNKYLPELLFKLQNKDEDWAYIEDRRYRSKYTPHSLRVSLITALVVDGGVHIDVISKLVGHSNIVMTIYYTKVGYGRMKTEIDRAEKVALARGVDRLQDIIINEGIEKAKSELISKDGQFLQSLGVEWPRSSYQVTDKGICAMGGGGCETGGLDNNGIPTNGPVIRGYLGPRNCIRCKYFITGPAFIGGLAALGNELLLALNDASQVMDQVKQAGDKLKDEKYDIENENRVFTKLGELNKNQSEYEGKVLEFDGLLSDFAAVQSLIEQCREVLILNNEKGSKNLIFTDSMFELDCVVEDSKTDFRLLCEICENASIFTSSSALRATPKRSQMLDRLAEYNGMQPMMYRLSEDEQLAIGNEAAELIKSYVARWSDVDRLIEGEILMNEIMIPESTTSLAAKFKNLITEVENRQALGNLDEKNNPTKFIEKSEIQSDAIIS